MPTSRPDPLRATRWWRRPGAAPTSYAVALGLAITLLATGCSEDAAAPSRAAGTKEQAAAPDPGRKQAAAAIERLLLRRTEALRAGDRSGFLETVATRRDSDRGEQVTSFDNLAQLPLGEVDLRLQPDTLRGDGTTWAGVVETTLELEGHDAAPVVRLARYDFARQGRGWRVTSDFDEEWQDDYGGDLQPWQTGAIDVETGPRVLGIFDEDSVTGAGEIIGVVEQGIDDISPRLPVEWNTRVVVYALSDTRMLRGLPQLPGGDPSALDAVAFPVVARAGSAELAATRFLLHPRVLDTDPVEQARLVRHELTHVALGERDDAVPVWLAEGIAEWVSVQALPESRRVVSGAALAAAEAGEVELPADEDFNGQDAAVNYGISWWAVQTIVDIYGEDRLWTLVDTLAQAPPEEDDATLEEVTGMDADQLAREAGRRIAARYG